MKVKLLIKPVEQVVDIPDVEIFGKTKEEITQHIYDKYANHVIALHNNVEITLLNKTCDNCTRKSDEFEFNFWWGHHETYNICEYCKDFCFYKE